MRVVGEFNNISDTIKEKIVSLKPGESAEYQLLECVTIQDPVTKQRETRYPHRMLYAKDTIYDPGKESTVDIGVIATGGIDSKNQTVVAVEKYEFTRPRDGILYLDGNRQFDRDLHEHLQITNFTQGGVLDELGCRDASKPYIFRLIDRKKEAKKRSRLFDIKADALVYVRNMDAEDIRDFAASQNWDYKGNLEELEEKVKSLADQDPLSFNEITKDPLLKVKSIVKKAMGVTITYDPSQHRIMWINGSVLATLERKENENELTAFAKWLSTVANGQKILQQVQKKPTPAAAE